MKSLCLTCKKMETKDPQGDDICLECSPQTFKCDGYVQVGREDYVPLETNFSRVTRSPEALAKLLTDIVAEAVEAALKPFCLFFEYKCDEQKKKNMYDRFLALLNKEAKESEATDEQT